MLPLDWQLTICAAKRSDDGGGLLCLHICQFLFEKWQRIQPIIDYIIENISGAANISKILPLNAEIYFALSYCLVFSYKTQKKKPI